LFVVIEPPNIIPLFPLPNLVLFPGVRLPLHIFEPRYREMVTDVVGEHGIIGMVLLKENWEADYHGHPDVFEVGCAGRLGGIVKLPDGRFNVVLDSISEFRIVREIRDRSYRRAEVQWRRVADDAMKLDGETMVRLRNLLSRYLGDTAEAAWRFLVAERGLEDAALINVLCFHLDISPIEKQTLLEAFEKRVNCLLDVLTFKIEERKLGPSGPGAPPSLVQ
jgi:Lon protease-like protein